MVLLGLGLLYQDMGIAFSNICLFLSENIHLLTILIVIINFILIRLIFKRENSENIILYCTYVVSSNGLFLTVRVVLGNQNIYFDSLWFFLNLISIVVVVDLVLRRNEEFKSY